MNIESTLLQKFCSEEWLARSYSEYLLDCATVQSDLLGEITLASEDDDLENEIETSDAVIADGRKAITDIVRADLIADGVINPEALATNSATFINKLHAMCEDQTSEVYTLVSDLIDYFPSSLSFDHPEYLFTLTPEVLIASRDQYENKLTDLIDTICTDFSIQNNTTYAMGNGFVNLKYLLKNVIKNLSFGNVLENFSLGATNGQDQAIGAIQLTASSVLDWMKSSMTSALAWGQGFATLGANSAADAIASFEASIKTVISDTTERFAVVVNQVKSHLSTSYNNIKGFFSVAYKELGWKEVVDDVFEIIDDTKVAEYTGSSPFSAIYLKTAGDVLLATAKTIGAAAAGIFMTVFDIVKKTWKRVRPFLSNFTSNPQDFKIDDSSSPDYCFCNSAYHVRSTIGYGLNNYDLSPNEFDQVRNDLLSMALNLADQWFTIDTYFGLLSFSFNGNASASTTQVNMGVEVQFKPKVLWYQTLEDSGLAEFYKFSGTPDVMHFGRENIGATNIFTEKFDAWLQNGDPYFHDFEGATTGIEEGSAIIGIMMSMCFMHYLCHGVMLDLKNQFENEYGWSINYTTAYDVSGSPVQHWYRADNYPVIDISWPVDPTITAVELPQNLTNLDFVIATSGYDSTMPNDLQFSQFKPDRLNSVNTSFSLLTIVGGLIAAIVYQRYDRLKSPADFFWLPYCKDTYDPSVGRYKIVSDAEHSNIVGIVTAALIVIAAVAAVVVLGKSILKFFKARKLAKWSSKVGVLDNAMWNGHKLTVSESARYLRAQKKLGAISTAGSGLIGVGSTISSVADSVSNLASNLENLNNQDSDVQDIDRKVTESTLEELRLLIRGY